MVNAGLLRYLARNAVLGFSQGATINDVPISQLRCEEINAEPSPVVGDYEIKGLKSSLNPINFIDCVFNYFGSLGLWKSNGGSVSFLEGGNQRYIVNATPSSDGGWLTITRL